MTTVIDRILKKYLINNNDQNIIEFLFKCLDKYKRQASVLFLNIKMDNQSNDLIIRLMNDYSDVFDFNMVNLRSILNTSSELIKELTKVKIEFTQKISEMNQIIIEQKNEINIFNEVRNLIDNDFKKLIQKQNQIIEEQKKEINKINNDRNIVNDEVKKFIQMQNNTNDEYIKLINELQSTVSSQKNEIMNQTKLFVTKDIQIEIIFSNFNYFFSYNFFFIFE